MLLPIDSHNPRHIQIMHALSHCRYVSTAVISCQKVKNTEHKLLSLIVFQNEGIFRKSDTESRLDVFINWG